MSLPAPLQRAPRCSETAPPIHRGSMVPRPWVGVQRGLLAGLAGAARPVSPGAEPWERAAVARRRVLLALIALASLGASVLLVQALPMDQQPLLRWAQVALYTLLFAWVSAGFFTALMGFWVQLFGDRHAISAAAVAHQPLNAQARTAIVMPICNEHVATVFAGLRATCESLAGTGAAHLFDVFVLSDTGDPALRDAELAAWRELRATLGPAGARLHYRWRQRRTRRKAGNVADFCRRWGRDYRYMVVLDADSVMSGDCLVSLVRLMEAHPRAGIIQTAPQACGLGTLHARAQQFAGRVTGRLFTAGMQFWQLGESHYWGHNAIIRVQPFMQHCALAPLPGRGGLSGDILSHDFVEAALMRRAGYHVWLVGDLAGSYEQVPSNLLEELQRDRRWCQGNLQNARLIAEPGLHAVHRAMLATGAMAYLSAPLWLVFMLLGGLLWALGGSAAAAVPAGLAGLWSATLVMLVLPRLLGVVALLLAGRQRAYGGTLALLRGSLLEGGLSALQAPVRMAAHSLFVLVALTGLKLDWKSPQREAAAVPWGDALRRFALPGAAGALALLLLAFSDTRAALWLSPVALPLALAVPMAVFSSRPGLGQWLRRRRLLLTPEEAWTPTVLRRAWAHAAQSVRHRDEAGNDGQWQLAANGGA